MAKKEYRVKGLDRVMKNLNREIKRIENRSMSGLIKSSVLIRKDMEDTSPKIPVDTGNLRASWFTSTFYDGNNPGLLIGFTAAYAVYVHEMLGRKIEISSSGTEHKFRRKTINWSRPGSGPKYLEAHVKSNTNNILKIIGEKAKIRR